MAEPLTFLFKFQDDGVAAPGRATIAAVAKREALDRLARLDDYLRLTGRLAGGGEVEPDAAYATCQAARRTAADLSRHVGMFSLATFSWPSGEETALRESLADMHKIAADLAADFQPNCHRKLAHLNESIARKAAKLCEVIESKLN